MGAEIVKMAGDDWPDVRRIYEQGIASGNATFEAEAPGRAAWDQNHLCACRFVARARGCAGDGDQLVGWGALNSVSGRCVYAGVAEVSVYVSTDAQRRGIGRALLAELVEASERSGIWTLQAGIFPENQASLALHRSCGFREVGRRERLGQLHGRWRDVILMERRSSVVGA